MCVVQDYHIYIPINTKLKNFKKKTKIKHLTNKMIKKRENLGVVVQKIKNNNLDHVIFHILERFHQT